MDVHEDQPVVVAKARFVGLRRANSEALENGKKKKTSPKPPFFGRDFKCPFQKTGDAVLLILGWLARFSWFLI